MHIVDNHNHTYKPSEAYSTASELIIGGLGCLMDQLGIY